MQHISKEDIEVTQAVALITNLLRKKCTGLSATKFADSYGIEKSTLLRIERAEVQCKLITIWKIANAFNMKCSELIQKVEEQLGDKFTLIEE